ncbi:MAG: 2-dehydropantoate 2-reductase [Pseudomonadota bacterium]
MKTAIVGAGGIGGHLAVKLGAAGNSVSVIARGAHLAAIREKGLALRTFDGAETVVRPAAASDRADDLEQPDIVVVAVKSQDLESAAAAMTPMVAAETVIWPIQNGVEATAVLAERFGTEKVLIGIARMSVHIAEPGVIQQNTPNAAYVVGEADGSQGSDRVRALRALLSGAGVETVDSADVRVDLWRKFAMLTAFSATTAGARCDGVTVAATPALRRLYVDIAREVVDLARAEGVDLPDSLPEEAADFTGRLAPGVRASMAHDLASGKPLEIDWLSGAVPRLGARHGLHAPANAAVAALLAPFRDGTPT